MLALVLVCALSVTMIAPTVGANAGQDQPGLSIGALATVAFTGGAGVLQRSAPSYDGAVVASLAEGETVTITEGPLSDASGQIWFGVAALATGYVPGFTLSAAGGATTTAPEAVPATDEVAPATDTTAGATVEPTVPAASLEATAEPIVSADSVTDTAGALLPGTAMVTDTNGDGARCRVGADYASTTIVVVPEGTVVTIAGSVELNDWQPIICGESQYGYIHTDFVTYALGEEPVDVVAPPVVPTETATVVPTEVTATAAATAAGSVAPTGTVTTEPVVTETATVVTATGDASAASASAGASVSTDEVGVADADASVSTDEVESADAEVSTLAIGAASWGTGYVSGTNGDGVRCRSAASYSASTITVLSEGSYVTMRGAAQGEWQPVTCGGQSGFAHVSFIKGSPSTPSNDGSTPDAATGTGASSGSATISGTNGGGLNCRATASYTGSVIAVISEGAKVSLRGAAQGEWQPVTCAGMGGYVNTAFISGGGGSTPPASTAPSTGNGSTNPGGATTGTATVSGTNGQGLICRASAAYGGAVLMVMPEGSSVSLNGSAQGEWQPVRCGSQSGFAHTMFLSSGGGSTPPASTAPSKAPSAAPSTAPSAAPSTGNGGGGASLTGGNARVTASLNLRYDARYSAGVAAVAPANTVVVVTDGPRDGFYRVEWDGLGGWMHGDYLVASNAAPTDRGGSAPAPTPSKPTTPTQPTQPTQPTTPPSGSGSSLVNYAMQYVGYPYVWAGAGPYGFDCSGFTKYVVQNVMGKNITHDMAVQINMGTPVSRGSLQPGDLIFFQNTFKFGLSHVGIYIGNGQFVHAENETTGVRVSDLNSDYYSSRWYGAARY